MDVSCTDISHPPTPRMTHFSSSDGNFSKWWETKTSRKEIYKKNNQMGEGGNQKSMTGGRSSWVVEVMWSEEGALLFNVSGLIIKKKETEHKPEERTYHHLLWWGSPQNSLQGQREDRAGSVRGEEEVQRLYTEGQRSESYRGKGHWYIIIIIIIIIIIGRRVWVEKNNISRWSTYKLPEEAEEGFDTSHEIPHTYTHVLASL